MNWVGLLPALRTRRRVPAHDKPQAARSVQLEAALREELLRAHAHGVVASVSQVRAR